MGTNRVSSGDDRLALLVAAPAVVLAAIGIVLIVLGWLGRNPFWPTTTVTMAEAAALRDQAAIVLLVEQGANPDVKYAVRAGLLGDRDTYATPMEAAIHEDRSEIVRLLVSSGASAATHVCEWIGLADSMQKQEVAAYLHTAFESQIAGCARRADRAVSGTNEPTR